MTHSDQAAVRRATTALAIAQSISSMGFLSMATLNAIIASRLSGTDRMGGVPQALILLGAAVSSYISGRLIGRIGRRNALLIGSVCAVIGGLIAASGVLMSALLVFFLGMIFFGLGRGALDQGRYAAAEINPPDRRASAVSRVVWGGTVGAVIGPVLAGPAGQFVNRNFGLLPDSGAPFMTALLSCLSGIVIAVLLADIDFKGLSQRAGGMIQRKGDENVAPVMSKGSPVLHQPVARAAMVTLACAQAAMALMMAVIGLHMKNHGHEADVGIVITAHVLGMFAFSPLVGKAADKLGRRTMIYVGMTVLALGSILTPLSLFTPWIMWSEFLVGLGWSMCYVSGSAMLTNALTASDRARSQGTSDLFVNLASGVGSLSSGLLLASFDFIWVGVVGVCISLLPLLAMWASRPPATKTASA
ncbi:MAG: MFS transporter [Anaerolineae bacterium]|nr:MFS transporter [Anaerolineae bacterium]